MPHTTLPIHAIRSKNNKKTRGKSKLRNQSTRTTKKQKTNDSLDAVGNFTTKVLSAVDTTSIVQNAAIQDGTFTVLGRNTTLCLVIALVLVFAFLIVFLVFSLTSTAFREDYLNFFVKLASVRSYHGKESDKPSTNQLTSRSRSSNNHVTSTKFQDINWNHGQRTTVIESLEATVQISKGFPLNEEIMYETVAVNTLYSFCTTFVSKSKATIVVENGNEACSKYSTSENNRHALLVKLLPAHISE